MSKLKLVVYAGMALFLVALMLMGCWRSGGMPGAGAPADRVNITPEVSISHLPKLYEPFTVTGKFRAAEKDEEDAEVWIAVKGAVYLDGEDRWHGPLKKGEEKVLSARFAMVTEGNHEVGAVAAKQKRHGAPEGTVIVLYVTSKESQVGWKDTGEGIGALGPNDPPIIAGGPTLVTETALALNSFQSPRIEVLQGPEDIARLQAEGALPAELRYQWRLVGATDFSQQLLLVVFDELRPMPGCLIRMEGDNFTWHNGIVKGEYRMHCLPENVRRSARPVSAVEVRLLGRNQTPHSGFVPGIAEQLAFQGARTFEFALDDRGTVLRKTVDLISLQSGVK
jgi:hypothetical protein